MCLRIDADWTVSGKPNRCDYEQLAPDEDSNNNGPDSKKNGKNKSEHHRRFGSIDDDDDRSSQDEDSGTTKSTTFTPSIQQFSIQFFLQIKMMMMTTKKSTG